MEKQQKHERTVLKMAKQVAVATNAHKSTPEKSEERKLASRVKWKAVDLLTNSVEIAERAGVDFEGGEP